MLNSFNFETNETSLSHYNRTMVNYRDVKIQLMIVLSANNFNNPPEI